VVFALKNYARFDSSGEMVKANLVEGIETVLTLYHNQLKHGVEVRRNLSEVPHIPCYPDELNQVWTNLVHNALQAMDHKGILTISLDCTDGNVVARFSDTGRGIPKELKERIFDPFFTTKPAGEGSGLGLHIVRRIIDKHEGQIRVDSEIAKGTTITVAIPIR